jgi:hypothetical protein
MDSTRSNAASVALTVALLLVQIVCGAYFCFAVFLSLFSFDACYADCDYTLGVGAFYGMVAVTVILVLTSGILGIVFRRSRRRSWLMPAVGLVLMIGTFLTALFLIDVAAG